MANTTRDIREHYPFLARQSAMEATAGLSDLLVNALDARLVVGLAADSAARRDACFRVFLREVSGSSARFEVDGMPGMRDRMLSVPVFVGRDNYEMTRAGYDDGWLILERAPASGLSVGAGAVMLHPDCVLIRQEAPELFFVTRPFGVWEDDAEQYAGQRDAAVPAAFEVVPASGIEGGSNVQLKYSGASGKLVITGSQGAGEGLLDRGRYLNGEELAVPATSGMRSVNGVQDAAYIGTDGVVGISAASGDGLVAIDIEIK